MKKAPSSRLNQVLNEVKEWSEDIWPPSGELDLYLSGASQLALANIDLSRYAMLEVSLSLLAAQQNRISMANTHMARAFSRWTYCQLTGILIKRGSNRTILGDLDGIAHTLLGAISTGQPHLVRPLFEASLEGIRGGYGVHDGHNPPPRSTLRYAGFALSIISDWLGTPIDLDAHALPRDPAWGQLVAHWREPDPEALLPALLLACDTHVERIAVTEREANALSRDFEFASVFLAVHPTEILAVLRLRDLLGLPNPVTIDHPLMQTPYAAITARPGEIADRDELLERYLATVRQRDPQALPPAMADMGSL